MKTDILHLALISFLVVTNGYQSETNACGLPPQALNKLAEQAVSPNKAVALSAINQLRSKGPEGLAALLQANTAAIQAHCAQPAVIETEGQPFAERGLGL